MTDDTNGGSVPPPDPRSVPDPGRRYDAMQVLQSLMEIQRDVAAVSTKADRLVSDVRDINIHVHKLNISVAWAKGFGVAAFILIPVCAAIVWWLIGGELTKMRDDILHARPQAAIASEPVASSQAK